MRSLFCIESRVGLQRTRPLRRRIEVRAIRRSIARTRCVRAASAGVVMRVSRTAGFVASATGIHANRVALPPGIRERLLKLKRLPALERECVSTRQVAAIEYEPDKDRLRL